MKKYLFIIRLIGNCTKSKNVAIKLLDSGLVRIVSEILSSQGYEKKDVFEHIRLVYILNIIQNTAKIDTKYGRLYLGEKNAAKSVYKDLAILLNVTYNAYTFTNFYLSRKSIIL